MLLMIDNYDSFTYNLVQYLGELGDLFHRNLVVADDMRPLPQFPEVLHEVVGERIVVVDHEQRLVGHPYPRG